MNESKSVLDRIAAHLPESVRDELDYDTLEKAESYLSHALSVLLCGIFGHKWSDWGEERMTYLGHGNVGGEKSRQCEHCSEWDTYVYA